MDGQLLGVLMSLLDIQNADFTDASAFKPDRSLASKKPVPLRGAGALTPSTKAAQAKWPTSVIEKSTSAFVPGRYVAEAYAGEQVNPSRARGNTDQIGEYCKMRASCPQQTASSLAHSPLGALEPGASRPSSSAAAAPAAATGLASFLDAPPPPAAAGVVDAPKSRAPAPSAAAPKASATAKLPAIKSAASSKFLSEQMVGASDALQRDTIRGAFPSSSDVAGVPEDAGGFFPAPAPAPGSAPGATTAVKRKKQPKKYMVSRKMKQKDRISDDYYELLRNVA